MLAHTLRPARLLPTLRQTVRHASVGGSSQTPIQDDKRDLQNKAREHSNTLVFGGLAAVGATAVWWMMADTSDPAKPTLKQTAGENRQPAGQYPPPDKAKL
ncbi:hypothetical protein JCM3775_006184 [Rhodotorula graminis]|uniref:Uncharacterized protein n=1 Tax=Rhodotorula graminis (strain WP1) TaxID=578459 RepID=A0A194S1E9_RHOGW|nr:uncharacterized protein RHOBADRAFT_66661 [Rhodotorula graminis WP1]KPV74548.1 hypothetical protein RHOBADRAFT_66661 [Rhodotorula graminis WP1]